MEEKTYHHLFGPLIDSWTINNCCIPRSDNRPEQCRSASSELNLRLHSGTTSILYKLQRGMTQASLLNEGTYTKFTNVFYRMTFAQHVHNVGKVYGSVPDFGRGNINKVDSAVCNNITCSTQKLFCKEGV